MNSTMRAFAVRHRKFLSVLAAGLVVAAAVVAIAASVIVATAPFTVLLAGLDEREMTAFRETIGQVVEGRNVAYRESAVPDGAAPGKPGIDLVVFRPGPGIAGAARFFAGVDALIKGRVSPVISAFVLDGSRAYAVPLLLDHFDLSLDSRFGPVGAARTIGMDEFEKTAHRLAASAEPVIAAAGKDDETLLALVSYAVIADSGIKGYRELALALLDGKTPEAILDFQLAGSASNLRSALARLDAWRRTGILHPNWLDMSRDDVRSFAAAGRTPAFASFLGDRRSMDRGALGRYAAIRFPTTTAGALVPVVVTTAAAVPEASRRKASGLRLLAKLAEPAAQIASARISGRAPATFAAQAPDIQARDARDVAVASTALAQGFAADACRNREEMTSLAAALRGLLGSWRPK
ncbi:MAG: hypothetical protein NT080_05655 [Spirochaetes bacterium]|nr:hypothetical protein [Spirochaetota bacterium]